MCHYNILRDIELHAVMVGDIMWHSAMWWKMNCQWADSGTHHDNEEVLEYVLYVTLISLSHCLLRPISFLFVPLCEKRDGRLISISIWQHMDGWMEERKEGDIVPYPTVLQCAVHCLHVAVSWTSRHRDSCLFKRSQGSVDPYFHYLLNFVDRILSIHLHLIHLSLLHNILLRSVHS